MNSQNTKGYNFQIIKQSDKPKFGELQLEMFLVKGI